MKSAMFLQVHPMWPISYELADMHVRLNECKFVSTKYGQNTINYGNVFINIGVSIELHKSSAVFSVTVSQCLKCKVAAPYTGNKPVSL